MTVPVIDIAPLIAGNTGRYEVAGLIGTACRESGFFYIVGHGVDKALQRELEAVSRRFFEQDVETKMRIRMALGGRAWRGYFPVGDELTSGKPDLKEGLYFGSELDDDHPKVRAGVPMHGRNLFPGNMPELRTVVLAYMDAVTRLGHTLMEGISLSLGLEETYFADRYTADPLTLFRIFHYPSEFRVSNFDFRVSELASLPSTLETRNSKLETPKWGVGEHTDYGLLTILKQDDVGGLQVKTRGAWTPAPPIPDSFVCNIGDMLDRLTRGLYRSTPHRVLNTAGRSRFSYPFFFDPNFDAVIEPIEVPEAVDPAEDRRERWDRASVHEFEGTYGDYILAKVGQVFPELGGG